MFKFRIASFFSLVFLNGIKSKRKLKCQKSKKHCTYRPSIAGHFERFRFEQQHNVNAIWIRNSESFDLTQISETRIRNAEKFGGKFTVFRESTFCPYCMGSLNYSVVLKSKKQSIEETSARFQNFKGPKILVKLLLFIVFLNYGLDFRLGKPSPSSLNEESGR